MILKATGIICVVLMTSATASNVASTEWSATNNKNGINAFIGKSVNSGVIPTKVEMTVSASPEKVLRVIVDVNNYSEWVPYCKKSFTIQKVSDTVSYAYQRISAPLVADRDLAMRMTIRSIGNKSYEVLMTAVPGFVKKETSTIRIEHFVARYHVYALTNNTTRIEQVCEVNIGGSIPTFLLKWANHNQPHETFENLREQILNS